MRYTLLLHYPEMTSDDLPAEALEEGQREMAAYADALHKAGVLVTAQILQHSHSTTTLRMVDGRLQVQDGPFADTKEQLGGTIVIDVADLDAAIEWGRQAPPIHWGAVEVRPGAVHVQDGVWHPSA